MKVISLNLLVTLAYFAAGYAGNLLSTPPGNVSPVWPAAGIALAVLIIYRFRVLPGLLLGILFAQIYAFADPAAGRGLAEILGPAAGITAGSLLQALAAYWLIERFVGRRDPLVENCSIVRFLILGGPVSCVTAPSLGTTTLYASGLIAGDELLLTWACWWIGDTIGTIIFAPIVLILFARPRENWRWRIKSVVLPLAGLLLLAMILFDYGYRQEWRRLSSEFERQANLLHLTLDDEIRDYIQINRAQKALFDSSTKITTEDFETFASSLISRSAGIHALEWIPRVPHEQRSNLEASWRGSESILEPASGETMVPARVRPEYFPIRYLVPYQGNERALGFDISSNPAALRAVHEARDTGKVAATGPIQLVQDPERRIGTVLYAPIYRDRPDWDSVTERRENFIGVAAGVFRVADKVQALRRSLPELQVNVSIHDGGAVIYTDGRDARFRNDDLIKYLDVPVANRSWRLAITPTTAFYQSHLYWNLWWLLLGAFAFTAFAGAGLLLLTGQTLRTEQLVGIRTRELKEESRGRMHVIELREMQNEVLHAIVGPATLHEILHLLVRITEATHPELICSIHLLDEQKKHLLHAAAPSLPKEFNDAIHGIEIGAGVGSCGTSAFTGKRIIIEDVFDHEYWKDYLHIARLGGIRACWAEPIVSGGEILGTFALYYREPRTPTAPELELIENLSNLASIAIDQKRAETRIERLAFYDTLTELPNRRLLIDRLEREIASVTRRGNYGAILYIDLDNFKTLNDSMGHALGDELLVQVSRRLKASIRQEDTAARIGGDEFVILIREDNADINKLSDRAFVLARRIQEHLNRPYDLSGYLHHISASIGITFFSSDVGSPDLVLKQADTAMYSAKARGRNTISFYHPDMQKHADDRLALEKDLRTAMDEGQFMVFYQPQYDENLKVVSAEALIRWNHPDKGIISPDAFIPMAEENKMILRIGAWVLQEVCRQLAEWPDLNYIAVNISPVELREPGFVEQVQKILRETGNGHRLMLEMTEGIMIGDVASTTETIKELQQLGIGISIDDFGRGYSSLMYLKDLPLDQLKIDKAFVYDIDLDPSGNIIVETIIAMAQHLKLSVIAEGVESRQQLTFLQEQGCTGFQGYYFSKPLNKQDFIALLKGSP